MAVQITRVLAPNPGPMTLEGTNTWVLTSAGASLVIDPGPVDGIHLAAVAAAAAAGGCQLQAIVCTHAHLDHSAGARPLAELTGAPVHAVRPDAVVAFGDARLDVLATPGHTADSVSLWLGEDQTLFTGDTVLGRGTTVVAHPDGRLADYLASLELLARLPAQQILPGHGPTVAEPAAWIAFYREHRAQRLAQVREAAASGLTHPRAIVEAVYADVDPTLWPAAELSVRAQLEYLAATT